MKTRILNLLIALDVFVFALITFGGSKNGETISAAAWDLLLEDKWQGKLFAPIIDVLFYPVQKEHCRMAWVWQNYLYVKA